MFSTGTPTEGAVNYTNANAVCGEAVTGDNPTNSTNQTNLTLPIIQTCAQPMGAKWIAAITNWLCFLIDGAGLEYRAGTACQDPLLLLHAIQTLIAASETCVKPGSAYPDNSDNVCAASPAYVYAAIQAIDFGGLALTTEAQYGSFNNYADVATSGYNETATTPGYVLEAILEQPIANTTTNGISREATIAECEAGVTEGSVPAFVTPEGLAAVGGSLGQWQAMLHPSEVPAVGSILNFHWVNGFGTGADGTGPPYCSETFEVTAVTPEYVGTLSNQGTLCSVTMNGGALPPTSNQVEIWPNYNVPIGSTWLITGTWTFSQVGGANAPQTWTGSLVRIS